MSFSPLGFKRFNLRQFRLRQFWASLIAMVFFVALGCSKKEGAAKFKIQLPPHPDFSTKGVSSLTEKKFCYLINVVGPGIHSDSKTCAPSMGLTTPFMDPMSWIEMSVPQGDGRDFQLFGYLPKVGEVCGQINKRLSDVDANRLFLMGSATGVSIRGAEVTVNLTASFPGLSNPYALAAGFPQTCWANLPPVIDGSETPSEAFLRGTHFAVRGAIRTGADSKIQKSSHFIVTSEVKNVAH